MSYYISMNTPQIKRGRGRPKLYDRRLTVGVTQEQYDHWRSVEPDLGKLVRESVDKEVEARVAACSHASMGPSLVSDGDILDTGLGTREDLSFNGAVARKRRR